MEKQQNNMSSCDSMTTVTMKDYTPGMEYPDPPPSYKGSGLKSSQLVQITKILAITAVTISGMISFAMIFSAWLTSSSTNSQLCQYQHQPSIDSILIPQSLRSSLSDDLESAESKLESKNKNSDKKGSSEEDSSTGEDDSVTMIKLPLELNLHEHMFEKNHRSHMNCVVEKKKAEEIVDEQSKPLPPLLGINISTDPRYLHFTGEKMAISCDSGNDHRRAPPFMEMFHGPPPPPHPLHHMVPPRHPAFGHGMPPPPMSLHHPLASLAAGSNISPLQIIGPISLGPFSHGGNRGGPGDMIHPHGFTGPSGPQMIPLVVSDNGLSIEDITPIFIPSNSQPQSSAQSQETSSPFRIPRPLEEAFHLNRQPVHVQKSTPREIPLLVQSTEIRERALHNPIPIVPRHHIQHVIRPRSAEETQQKPSNRVKRCACDCACKNHEG